MLCERCKKNQASVFLKQTINAVTKEERLCAKCAGEVGAFKQPGFPFEASLFSLAGLPKTNPVHVEDNFCPGCGMTRSRLFSGEKPGCPKCYQSHRDLLLQMARKVHGNAVHKGRAARLSPPELLEKNKRKELERELSKAIEQQNYERAAEVRDEIKALDASKKGGDEDGEKRENI